MAQTRVGYMDVLGKLRTIGSYSPDLFPAWMETSIEEEFKILRETIAAYRVSPGRKKHDVDYEEVEFLLDRAFTFFKEGQRNNGKIAFDCIRHILDDSREVRAEFIEALKKEA